MSPKNEQSASKELVTSLQRIAQKAEIEPDKQIIVFIDVDSHFPIVEDILPGHDWERIRVQGIRPVFKAVVTWNFCHRLIHDFPEDKVDLITPPKEGTVRLILLLEEGLKVRDLQLCSKKDLH